MMAHGPRETVAEKGGRQLVLMDSISYAGPEDRGVFAVSASHGGKSSSDIAGATGIAGAVFNDAGVGKDAAGIAGLALLERQGMLAVAVSFQSARIGDARDTWESGIISHANAPAVAAGFRVGMRVQDALNAWLTKPA